MAHGNEESKLDQVELENLQKSISQVEAAKAASTPASRGFFENVLFGARARVAALEKKIKEMEEKREARAHAEHVILAAQMAEMETKLNAEEKETFSGFLQKACFTKADFASLESFYSKTWDRLSEAGKDAMSHRIYEGIRRSEYAFAELPRDVREKEIDWAYSTLVKREHPPAWTRDIPPRDRDDFIRAYEGGRKEECQDILGREGFKRNLFRSIEPKGVSHTSVQLGRENDGDSVERLASADAPKLTKPSSMTSDGKSDTDLSAFGLEGVKLVNGPDEISSAEIKAVTAAGKSGPSLSRG